MCPVEDAIWPSTPETVAKTTRSPCRCSGEAGGNVNRKLLVALLDPCDTSQHQRAFVDADLQHQAPYGVTAPMTPEEVCSVAANRGPDEARSVHGLAAQNAEALGDRALP
jgi:hypothetical protein